MLAVRARWRGKEGYLHVSDEYTFAAFKGELGTATERSFSSIRQRLVTLAVRSRLIEDVDFSCADCSVWHSLAQAQCKPVPAAAKEDRQEVPPSPTTSGEDAGSSRGARWKAKAGGAPAKPDASLAERGHADGLHARPIASQALEYIRGYALGVRDRSPAPLSGAAGELPARGAETRAVPSAKDEERVPPAPARSAARREISSHAVGLSDCRAFLFLPDDIDGEDGHRIEEALRALPTCETPAVRGLEHRTVRLNGCLAALCLPRDLTTEDVDRLLSFVARRASMEEGASSEPSTSSAALPISASAAANGEPTGAFASWTTEALRAELARALEVTADHLLRLAGIWRELEARGEDLSDLRKGLAFYLPLIASGKVDALAVSRFAGAGNLLRVVATLPVDVQRSLGRGETVRLCLAKGEEIEEVERDPLTLNGGQIRQVFSEQGVRPPEAQRALILQRKKSPGRPVETLDDRTVAVRIPEGFYRALCARAKERGMETEGVLIQVLQAAGIVG